MNIDNYLLALQADLALNARRSLSTLGHAVADELAYIDRLEKEPDIQGHIPDPTWLPTFCNSALETTARLRLLVQMRRATAGQFVADEGKQPFAPTDDEQHDGSDY